MTGRNESFSAGSGQPSYYHGTSAELKPGDKLLPGSQVGRGRGKSVWLTPHPDAARSWANSRLMRDGHGVDFPDGGRGPDPSIPVHVYEVHPHGLTQDRNGHFKAEHAVVKRRVP